MTLKNDHVLYIQRKPWCDLSQHVRKLFEKGTIVLTQPSHVRKDKKETSARTLTEENSRNALETIAAHSEWLETRIPTVWNYGSIATQFDYMQPDVAIFCLCYAV